MTRALDLEIMIVIDVIEIQQRQARGIGAAAAQMGMQIGQLELGFQGARQ